MLYVMLLAHLLGDYLFQWNSIARWKARALTGVLVHGSIVTLTTLICTAFASPSWWPHALLIGIAHTAIDLVRARFVHTAQPAWQLAWYLVDQLAHLAVIVLVVTWSGYGWRLEYGRPIEPLTGAMSVLANRQILACVFGYVLLLNPAWVLLRFAVRGVWGPQAAPILGEGEKYGPMVERVLIATCVLTGLFYLAPFVLLPRRLTPIRVQGQGVGVLVRPTSHWAETILSAVLAIAIGLALRMIGAGS